MKTIDIVILISVSLIVLAIIASYIYKKVKNIPIDSCGCHSKRSFNRMLKNVRKDLDNNCCCKKEE